MIVFFACWLVVLTVILVHGFYGLRADELAWKTGRDTIIKELEDVSVGSETNRGDSAD